MSEQQQTDDQIAQKQVLKTLNQGLEDNKMQVIQEPIEIKPEDQLPQEFVEDNVAEAQALKTQGNNLFKEQEFSEAIMVYNKALKYASKSEVKLRSVIYSNIGICFSKVEDYKNTIVYCKRSLENDDKYMKARLNLAMAYEKNENPQEALEEYKKIIEMNPSDIKSQIKVKQLEKVVAQLNEKRKTEVLDGLKNIGNSVLGFFGLSLNNFQMQQGPSGGYNVSFKN